MKINLISLSLSLFSLPPLLLTYLNLDIHPLPSISIIHAQEANLVNDPLQMDVHVLLLLAEQSVEPQKLWYAEEEQPTELLAKVGHFVSPRRQDDFRLSHTFFDGLRGDLTGEGGACVPLVDVLDVTELT